MTSTHANRSTVLTFPCPSCGLTFLDIKELDKHVRLTHSAHSAPPITSPIDYDLKYYLKLIFEQNQEAIRDMAVFRKDMQSQFSALLKSQEDIKNDIRNIVAANKVSECSPKEREEDSLVSLIKSLDTIKNGMEVLESNQIHLSQQIRDVPSSVSAIESDAKNPPSSPPKQPLPSKNPVRTCNKCDFIIHSDQHLRKHMKVRHGLKDKILWVGDSINSNVDFKDVSIKSGMEIFPAKAYTVTKESPGARFPDCNFLDVVERELSNKEYDVLVIGGGIAEITNLDTDHAPVERLAEFKESVLEASKRLFSLAETALHSHPTLDKVILLKKPPRFDPKSVDPLELKPQLSQLADSALFEMWCESSLRKKIFLGDHTIPHKLDEDHHKVFGNPAHPSYDGLHMNGPSGKLLFHESIMNILTNTGVCKPTLTSKPLGLKPYPHSTRASQLGKMSKQQYNPLRIFRERISSMRVTTSPSTANPPSPTKPSSPTSVATSVIRPIAMPTRYSVPVSNSFAVLGN